MTRLYQTALGIETGDIITTPGFKGGPYEVYSISPPRHVLGRTGHICIRTYPVISLGMSRWGEPFAPIEENRYSIGEIRREADGRYFTVCHEVIVQKPEHRPEMQVDMFASYPQADEPYTFQEGVDYMAGDGKVWKCDRCKRDYNGVRGSSTSRFHPPRCPHCQGWGLQSALILGDTQQSTYIRGLNT